ncbi:MAG: hypothetical protein MUC84_11805 [Solirubrobacteraceae bacterium]|jgi:hypothetical protein|nr:hypothetical protein [Solirubrobacteraceae bacterium]MCU0314730.1 hypothetical protein [Solirubrobacteraceae bacterium]
MSVAARAGSVWRELFAEQRLAAIAAAGLLVSLFLPWYTETAVRGGQKTTYSLNPFESWGFVELSVALVALGVLALVVARGERRAFHLPFGDGIVILAAGAWVLFLVFYRSVDSPGDGVTWGLLVAFVFAALLAGAGWRMHARHRPEPLVDGDDPRTTRLEGDPTSVAPREEPGTAVTQVAHAEEQPTRPIPPDERPTRPLPAAAPRRRRPGGRRRPDGQFEGQMSFDDPDAP